MGCERTLPNFLVVGASRSGTTALYRALARRPDVFVTPVMEPRFFAFENDPMDYRGPGDELLRARVTTRLEDYAALFEGRRDEPAVGEVSPAYLSAPSAPAAIRRHAPDCRIVAILRNPVARAVSSFRLHRLEGFEPEADLQLALDMEPARKRARWSYAFAYLERGFYGRQLAGYLDVFPREQVLVALYEDWSAPDGALLRSVLGFVGAGEGGGCAVERVNATDACRFARRGIARYHPTEAVVARLVEAYRDDIGRLGKMIGRDLSHWLEIDVRSLDG